MFFFFKQKTAYEMRISDWSSDVCSSDLGARPGSEIRTASVACPARFQADRACRRSEIRRAGSDGRRWPAHGDDRRPRRGRRGRRPRRGRSEEHTSELQSLMRTSYAVFCLKKKKTPIKSAHHTHEPTEVLRTSHHICNADTNKT